MVGQVEPDYSTLKEMEIFPKKMKKPTSIFNNLKMFVLCHGLLQLTQLLYSSYFKSTITTIERRFGLSSYSSGTISSLHEVGNTVLIVFVSYFGSRVNRPRFIGVGGLLMSISAMMLTLPHFLSDAYVYNSVLHDRHDICNPQMMNSSAAGGSCGIGETSRRLADKTNLWLLMTSAQLLFGVGSVPIQPFGISYIDDFAGPNNSPLYIAILFAVSTFGPAFGFLMGAAVLKIWVDVDRTGSVTHEELVPSDPRWVGAWWMGLLITSMCLALTSIPYFFFPRSMPQEFVTVTETDLNEDPKKTDGTLLDFMKAFPRLFVRLLLSPLFLILVLAQCCFSSVIAGLATFLNAFLERQYSSSASFSSMLMGAVNLPCVAVGMLVGGVIMKKVGLSLKAIPRFSVVMLVFSTVLVIPLFFMGCPTQKVAEVNYHQHGSMAACYSNCSCPDGAFNPVCGSDGIEYVSPCHAGCTNFTRDPNNTYRVQSYTSCQCISDGQRHARPGPCANSCPHYLLPVMFILSAAGLIAALTHNPLYMMVLRIVPYDEKSFAIGVQFLLMRLLAWLPAPAFFGMAIDTSCIRWKEVCGKRSSCGYYDNNILRNRYLGLQVGYKVTGIGLLMLLGWKVQRTSQYSLEKRPDGPL